jgi:glucan 1,3-beta-glucosidase
MEAASFVPLADMKDRGTYLVSTPIEAYYYSQLVGDALEPPTIKSSANFIGL